MPKFLQIQLVEEQIETWYPNYVVVAVVVVAAAASVLWLDYAS